MRFIHIMGQACGLIFVSASLAALSQLVHPHRPVFYQEQVPLGEGEITLEQIAKLYGTNVLWIDARTQREYKNATIPGALYLGANEFDRQLEEHFLSLQDEQRPVVVFCSQQACQASHQVRAKLMEALPLLKIYTLHGGWRAWEQSPAAKKSSGPQ